MAEFSNPDTQRIFDELVKSGVLDRRLATQLQFDERIGQGNLTPDDVFAKVNVGKLRMDEYERLEELASSVSASVPEYKPAISTQLGTWWDEKTEKFDDSEVFGVTDPTTPGEEVGQFLGDQYRSGQRNRQLKNDFVRIAKDGGYDLDRADLTGAGTLAEMAEAAARKANVPFDVAVAIGEEVDTMRLQRELDTKDVEEALEVEEEMDRVNESNPMYAKNLAQFEILDEISPTKYQFHEASGAIFMTDGSGQVDPKTGKVIPFENTELGGEVVGGWGAGGAPDFSNAFEESLAFGLQTGWAKMSEEAGFVVDENSYMDVLDVIANKGGYGADPTRYLTGEGFLGGFDADYRVDTREQDVADKIRDYGTVHGRQQSSDYGGFGSSAFFSDFSNFTQETRRPWYEDNDNWAQFAGMSSENIAAVQSRMVEVGALEADEVIMGNWGPTEAAQMEKWMAIANGQGLQWQDVDESTIRGYFTDEKAERSPRAAFVPEAYRPMDPATAERTVKDSVRQMIGREPTSQDMQELGGYLTDMHSASYQADVSAARNRYSTQVSLDDTDIKFGQPAAVEDVDYESRYINEMEKRFAPQLESQKGQETAQKQQDMGVKMSNLMSFVGGS